MNRDDSLKGTICNLRGLHSMWQWTSMLNLHIAMLGHISSPSRCLNSQNMAKKN